MVAKKEFLIDTGDIYAPKGTRPWCVGVREQARSALQNAKATREDVVVWVTALKEDDNFRKLSDAAGHHFLSWEAFCAEPLPYGFGMTPDEVDALIESKPVAQKLAADPRVGPSPENGEIGRGRNSPDNIRPNAAHGTSAEYLVRRLKRDHPEIAKALARGEYRSAREAAIAAGIVKPLTRLDRMKREYRNAEEGERKAFLSWVDDDCP